MEISYYARAVFGATLMLMAGHLPAQDASSPSTAAQAASAATALSPQEMAAIQQAEDMGRRLYLHDTAAWLTTDALVQAGAFAEPIGVGQGWLTLDRDNGVWVGYFAKVDQQLFLIAEATLARESREVIAARKLSPPRSATQDEATLLAARNVALAQDALRCTDAPFNTTTIRETAQPDAPILVFLMSAMTNENSPMGGFHRFRLTPDGTRVLEHFAQTNSCINLPTPNLRDITVVSLTHLTSPTPTLFHVFLSLQNDRPIMLLTEENGRLWRIDHGVIGLIGPDDPEFAAADQWAQEVRKANASDKGQSP